MAGTMVPRRDFVKEPSGRIAKLERNTYVDLARLEGPMRYAVTLTPDDNGTVLVSVPDFADAITFGEDRDDALGRALDAIETAMMARMSAREDIPLPKAKGKIYVDLPALTVAKVELWRAMRAEGLGKAALAKKLGLALPQVDRLLDLRHGSRLDQIERAFGALGRTLSVVVGKVA